MGQRKGKNLRTARLKVGWLALFALAACSNATEPDGDASAPMLSTDVTVQRNYEELELGDVSDRILPTLEDQSAANALMKALRALSEAYEERDATAVNAALKRSRALLLASDMHPVNKTILARALDAIDAGISQEQSAEAH